MLVIQRDDQQVLRVGYVDYRGFIDDETGGVIGDENARVTHWAWMPDLPEIVSNRGEHDEYLGGILWIGHESLH